MKNHIIDTIVYSVLGILVWFIGFMCLKPYAAETYQDSMKFWSDTFIIPGILLVGLYILSIFGKKGMYDGLTYSFRFIAQSLLPFLVKSSEKESYYEYKKNKAEKRKEPRIAGLIVGLVFIVVALVFYVLYKLS